jgi:hypothetical protein
MSDALANLFATPAEEVLKSGRTSPDLSMTGEFNKAISPDAAVVLKPEKASIPKNSNAAATSSATHF